jgi:hypothetical protein
MSSKAELFSFKLQVKPNRPLRDRRRGTQTESSSAEHDTPLFDSGWETWQRYMQRRAAWIRGLGPRFFARPESPSYGVQKLGTLERFLQDGFDSQIVRFP